MYFLTKKCNPVKSLLRTTALTLKEYTKIVLSNSIYSTPNKLELGQRFYFKFKNEKLSRAFSVGVLTKIVNDKLIIFETQGYYDRIPLNKIEKGTELEIFETFKRVSKIADGLIESRYFEKATKDSWKITQRLDLENSIERPVHLEFSIQAKEYLTYGNTPISMDDKWFVYTENEDIHFFRSWTGIEVFQAKFIMQNDHWIISTLIINSSKEVADFAKESLFKILMNASVKRMEKLINS